MDLQSGFPKKTLFWKYMLVGLQGMYQEYDLYERLAKDRRFDMSRHLKKTMDRLYQAAATGYRLDDKYILTIECSYFEPRDKWEELALQIVRDLEDFFRIAYEKDCKKAGAFLKRPMQILEQFAAFSPNIDLEKATKKEQQYLAQLIQEVSAVDKSGKKACIETIKQSARPSLIGEELLEHRAPIQKEKPDKKTFPLIRRTSLRYDYDIERLKKMKELNPAQWEGTMCLEAETVLAGWYRSALETLYSLELFEYGYPLHGEAFNHERHLEASISGAMVRAYASGAKELLARLYYFSYDKSCKDLYKLLCGKADAEQYAEADKEGHINSGIHAVLQGDGKALTKELLARVRYIRGWYELYSIATDEWGYMLVRLAEERGLAYQKVEAAELLDCIVRQPVYSEVQWEKREETEQWLEAAKTKHFRLDKIFPYVEEGKTVRRPDTSLDTIAYLGPTDNEEALRLCKELDYQGLYQYAEEVIKSGEHLYLGYTIRAYAHMQLYREQYQWEQVFADLSEAIQYSYLEDNAFWRRLEVMVRRSRALINPDKESEVYRQDIAYLQQTDENKAWYYRGI